MASLREIKTAARRALHQAMRVPASYYETPIATPRLIHVRVHTKWTQHGDLKGTNLNYAEAEEVAPTLIFDRSEVENPPAGGFVIISAEEGYRIGQTKPKDGITITAEVARLRAAEIAGKTLPEDL